MTNRNILNCHIFFDTELTWYQLVMLPAQFSMVMFLNKWVVSLQELNKIHIKILSDSKLSKFFFLDKEYFYINFKSCSYSEVFD